MDLGNKRNKKVNTWKKIVFILFLCALSLSAVCYYIFVHKAKQELQTTLNKFESACRSGNIQKINEIAAKGSVFNILEQNRINTILEIFNKFEEGIKVTKAFYLPGALISNESYDIISGDAKMKAIKDGKLRILDSIYIKREGGVWKVHTFGFPDYIDY